MAQLWTVVPVALVTSVLGALVTVALAERKLRRDHRLDFAAERVARLLLQDSKWPLRRFTTIRRYLNGFESDNALRATLIKAGAVCFRSKNGKTEYWGLLERNRDRLSSTVIEDEPAPDDA